MCKSVEAKVTGDSFVRRLPYY